MAHIVKKGVKWRAEVCVDNKRKAKTFNTKREAVAWSHEIEEDGILAQHTFRNLIEKYTPIAMAHKGSASESSRLKQMEKATFIDLSLEDITADMIGAYRDARLKEVAPTSVRREMIIMSSMFKEAVVEFKWLKSNPVIGLRKPQPAPPRRRGVRPEEIDAISAALKAMSVGPQVDVMFRLSIETGMRLGELLSLTWANVREKAVTLPATKNGDRRDVPLSVVARSLIEQRKNLDPVRVFTLNQHVASTTFRRARAKTAYAGVHFHDARAEALTRLSRKLDVLSLAKIIGHRDTRSLMMYYSESADSMADRL